MDETTLSTTPHYRMEGFANQRLCVVPRPQVDAALQRPVTRWLTVTDAGYFPHATGHRMRRGGGARETIVLLCVAGTGTVEIASETHTLSAGTGIVIPAGVPHSYEASADSPWTIWWLHSRGSEIAELTAPIVAASQQVVRLRSLDRVVALFDEVVSTLERRLSPAHLLAASAAATYLLTRFSVDSVLPGTVRRWNGR